MWACRCHWKGREWRSTGNARNTSFSQKDWFYFAEVCAENHFTVISLFFLPLFLKDPLGCDGSHRHIVFRSEFHFKLRNREDGLRFVLVSEAGRVARSPFFRHSFTRACTRFWAIARLIETWRRSGISWAYVLPGCTDVVKPILYRAAHRRRVPPAASNLLNDSYVCCEKYK